MKHSVIKSLFFVSALVVLISCETSLSVEEISPNYLSSNRNSENVDNPKDVIRYLKSNGFVEDIDKKMTSKIKRNGKNITMSEAMEVVKFLKNLENSDKKQSLSQQTTIKNGRVMFIACEDAGTYYINRALDAAISGVDIRFERALNGTIQNVTSYTTGLALAWSWDQLGVNIFGNGKTEFCIDGRVTYGIDIDGMPLGYQQGVSLRIRLDGCSASVQTRYGHC